jgi:type VI protein secretion system component VasK
MDYGLWFMVYGLWLMVYGLWFMVYGLWFMVYGLWFMFMVYVYGLWLRRVRSQAKSHHAHQARPREDRALAEEIPARRRP